MHSSSEIDSDLNFRYFSIFQTRNTSQFNTSFSIITYQMKYSELIIQLNARLLPKNRHQYFGIPIKNRLEEIGFGSIIAAGTLKSNNGEIEYCDIAVETNQNVLERRDKLIEILNEIGTPKGSKNLLE
jgi:hypothetical protein